MLYVIYAQEDPKNLEVRLKYRSEHISRLQKLKEDGRLILAGPFPAIDSENPQENGFQGAVIIAEFKNIEEAESFMEKDPFVINKVYQNIKITPFLRSL